MKNIVKYNFSVDKSKRIFKYKQIPKLIWFTGLSGSGKSTLANSLEIKLFSEGYITYCLDGDNIRNGISNDLDFTEKDRTENIRRIAEVSKLMLDAGIIVCASFITPLISQRKLIKNIVGHENFLEIYVSTSLNVCENRDVKGLYAKARSGIIKNFTGISSTYEIPKSPLINIDTSEKDVESCTDHIYSIVNKIINEKNQN